MNTKLAQLGAVSLLSVSALSSLALPSLFAHTAPGKTTALDNQPHQTSNPLAASSLPKIPAKQTVPPSDPFAQERLDFLRQIEALNKELLSLQGTDRQQHDRITQLTSVLNDLAAKHTALILESNEERTLINTLSAQLLKLQQEKYDLIKPVKLRVEFRILDVYLDGERAGPGHWKVFANVNGLDMPIWSKRKTVSDNGNTGNGPGPGGDRDSTRYSLGGHFIDIEVPGDGQFQVKFAGNAYDGSRPVNESSMTFSRANGWGMAGNKHYSEGHNLNRMGAAGRQTEYWVFFSIRPL